MTPAHAARLSNLRRSPGARSGWVILPAFVSLLALAGVTTQPTMRVAKAREALLQSGSKLAQFRQELAKDEHFERAHLREKADAVLDLVRRQIPAEVPPVVAHGIVRVACTRAGVQLESLHVGEMQDLGLSAQHDLVSARSVTVSGVGRLSEIVGLLDELRAHGYPTCVLEVKLERAPPEHALNDSRRFGFQLELGLMHYAPLESVPNLPDAQVSTSKEAP